MASFWSSRLAASSVLRDLEVFGGRLVGVDGVLVALGGVLRQGVGPGLGVDVGVGVACTAAASPLMNRRTAASRTASRRASSWPARSAACASSDWISASSSPEPGLGVGQVGGGRVGPAAGVGQAAVVGARARARPR